MPAAAEATLLLEAGLHFVLVPYLDTHKGRQEEEEGQNMHAAHSPDLVVQNSSVAHDSVAVQCRVSWHPESGLFFVLIFDKGPH